MKYKMIQIKRPKIYNHMFGLTYWKKLKKYRAENGRYMIKFLRFKVKNLAYGFSEKHYFIHFDNGFCRGGKKNERFYTNNFRKLVVFAKFCSLYMDNDYLTSIVDRKTGLEYYIICSNYSHHQLQWLGY